jgi:hypothetical protein
MGCVQSLVCNECGQKVKPWDAFVDRGEVLGSLRRRRV